MIMKKYIIRIMLIMVMLLVQSSKFVYAEENVGVRLDAINFPDAYVREVLHDEVDTNGDYVLQQEEIAQTMQLYFAPEDTDEGEDSENRGEDYYTIDCTGLRYFENLKSLQLDCPRHPDKQKGGFLHLEEIYELKNLELLVLEGDRETRSFDFRNFPRLKYLFLTGILNEKEMQFDNPQLKTLEMSYVEGEAIDLSNLENLKRLRILDHVNVEKLDLSKLKSLETLEVRGAWMKKLKLGSLNKLTKIKIWAGSGASNKYLKTLDVSKVKNLKSLKLCEVPSLKSLKFGKQKKLKNIDLSSVETMNKKLRKLNISQLKNIEKISVDDFKGLKAMQFSKKQKFKNIFIRGCKKLKYIDLKTCKITKKLVVDKGTKIVNIRKGQEKKIQYK